MRYWHITHDPNFQVDPTRGPTDLSSLVGEQSTEPGFMFTDDPHYWASVFHSHPEELGVEYENENPRLYAAEIDPGGQMGERNSEQGDWWPVQRGFGSEFYHRRPDLINVKRVVPLSDALKETNNDIRIAKKGELHVGLGIPKPIAIEIHNWAEEQDWPEGTELEPIEEYHITLLYSQEGHNHKNDSWIDHDSHAVSIKGIKAFPSKEHDDKDAIVLMVDSETVQDHHDDLASGAEDAGIEISPYSHDDFKPHITIAYGSLPKGLKPPKLTFETEKSSVSSPREERESSWIIHSDDDYELMAKGADPYEYTFDQPNDDPHGRVWVYHSAPTEDRARIRAHGLVPSLPELNPQWEHEVPLLGGQSEIYNEAQDQPKGIYVSRFPRDFYFQKPTDVWRALVNPYDLKHDPIFQGKSEEGKHFIHSQAIAPENLELYEPWEQEYNWKFPQASVKSPYMDELKKFADSWVPKDQWPRAISDGDMPIGEQPKSGDCTCKEGHKLDCLVHGMHPILPTYDDTLEFPDPSSPVGYDYHTDAPRTWMRAETKVAAVIHHDIPEEQWIMPQYWSDRTPTYFDPTTDTVHVGPYGTHHQDVTNAAVRDKFEHQGALGNYYPNVDGKLYEPIYGDRAHHERAAELLGATIPDFAWGFQSKVAVKRARHDKLWVDDTRRPPSDDWDWARNVAEAIELTKGPPGEPKAGYDHMSLDHDLGIVKYEGKVVVNPDAMSGGDFVMWLHEHGNKKHMPKSVNIHSHNKDASELMRKALEPHCKVTMERAPDELEEDWAYKFKVHEPSEIKKEEIRLPEKPIRSNVRSSHQLAWLPGSNLKGKGLVTPSGDIHTWPVDDEGMPHHAEYVDKRQPYQLHEGTAHFFQIRPRGGLDTKGYDIPANVIHHVLKTVPSLRPGEHTDWHYAEKKSWKKGIILKNGEELIWPINSYDSTPFHATYIEENDIDPRSIRGYFQENPEGTRKYYTGDFKDGELKNRWKWDFVSKEITNHRSVDDILKEYEHMTPCHGYWDCEIGAKHLADSLTKAGHSADLQIGRYWHPTDRPETGTRDELHYWVETPDQLIDPNGQERGEPRIQPLVNTTTKNGDVWRQGQNGVYEPFWYEDHLDSFFDPKYKEFYSSINPSQMPLGWPWSIGSKVESLLGRQGTIRDIDPRSMKAYVEWAPRNGGWTNATSLRLVTASKDWKFGADQYDTREYADTRMMPPTTMQEPVQNNPHPEKQGCTCDEGKKLDCPIHGMNPTEQDIDHSWSIPENFPVGYPQDQPRNYIKAEGKTFNSAAMVIGNAGNNNDSKTNGQADKYGTSESTNNRAESDESDSVGIDHEYSVACDCPACQDRREHEWHMQGPGTSEEGWSGLPRAEGAIEHDDEDEHLDNLEGDEVVMPKAPIDIRKKRKEREDKELAQETPAMLHSSSWMIAPRCSNLSTSL